MAEHVTSRQQQKIDKNDNVTKEERSPLNDCNDGMEELQKMETVRSPSTEKCTGISVFDKRSKDDVDHDDDSDDINGANQQNFSGEAQQLHPIQKEQERMVDTVTTEECNEKSVCDALSKDDVLCDIQQTNETEKRDQSASSHEENICLQSEGTSSMMLNRSVRNRKGGAREITPTSGDTGASSKTSRAPGQHTKEYSCAECNKRFEFQSILIAHLRAHSGEQPYKCTECNKAFKQSGNLKIHRRTHSGEKPYKCTECNSAYIRLSDLKRHQITHSPETAFSCDICKKSFCSKQSLSTHMDIHRGIKRHKCNICEKEFRSGNNLRTHLINHHTVSTHL